VQISTIKTDSRVDSALYNYFVASGTLETAIGSTSSECDRSFFRKNIYALESLCRKEVGLVDIQVQNTNLAKNGISFLHLSVFVYSASGETSCLASVVVTGLVVAGVTPKVGDAATHEVAETVGVVGVVLYEVSGATTQDNGLELHEVGNEKEFPRFVVVAQEVGVFVLVFAVIVVLLYRIHRRPSEL
jgi:hypothetical protein